jgi:hypothetical protein
MRIPLGGRGPAGGLARKSILDKVPGSIGSTFGVYPDVPDAEPGLPAGLKCRVVL